MLSTSGKGPSGTGKTHVATALGVAACRQGTGSCSPPPPTAVTRLPEANDRGRLAAELIRLRCYGPTIVDEVGYLPGVKAEQASLN